MPLRISGSTSGYVELAANAVGSNNTLTIPTVSSGTLIASDAAGNVAVTGSLFSPSLDVPYLAASRTNGYTVADGWSDITWENSIANSYITVSSANIQFSYVGKYKITVGWRFGSGGDVWTGVRLIEGVTQRGIGYGTGQINTADPGPCEITFVATIPSGSTNSNMRVQFYRQGSTMAIATPGGGNQAVVLTISWIGI